MIPIACLILDDIEPSLYSTGLIPISIRPAISIIFFIYLNIIAGLIPTSIRPAINMIQYLIMNKYLH